MAYTGPPSTPTVFRRNVPSTGSLGFLAPQARERLEKMGWYTPDHISLLWALSRGANPDNVLHTLLCLWEESTPQMWQTLTDTLCTDTTFRGRLIGILGASIGLGDHIIANPESLWLLTQPELPSKAAIRDMFLAMVDHACAEEGKVGYGPKIVPQLVKLYRDCILVLAARDLAATVEDEPVLSLKFVGEYLADLADVFLEIALHIAKLRVIKDKSRPIPKIAIMSLGKCGGRELNYVSDVDVIFVAEPANAISERIASETVSLASLAFCTVDPGLRPEGKNGVLTRTVDSHEAYYDKWAQTWEFQALLKARYSCGDAELAQEYLDRLTPKIWEASLREGFIEEIRAMKRRVEDSIPLSMQNRELKLGKGGLRDIEFSVQLLQLVHGRIDEHLRVASTLDSIAVLTERAYLSRNDGANIAYTYEFLRILEHRLQLQNLRRTHTLPEFDDYEAMRELARAAHVRPGHDDVVVTLRNDLQKHFSRSRKMHRKIFFEPILDAVIRFSTDLPHLDRQAVVNQLEALGFNHPNHCADILSKLMGINAPHQEKNSVISRNRSIHRFLLPSLLEYLSKTSNPDRGLQLYWRFSEKLREERWLVRLIREDATVAERLMTVLASSEYVFELISRSPEIVKSYADTAVGPDLLNTNAAIAASAIIESGQRAHNAETAINVARSLRRAELARIASADILGMLNVPEVCSQLSVLRGAVIESAVHAVAADIDKEAATKPGYKGTPGKIAVIGMGRLGGWELGYGSDADVMFVCEANEGFTDVEVTRWGHKVVEKMRKLLGKPSQDPPIDIDVDLRPEGKTGPLIRTLESYRTYYSSWSQVWERQALLRANFLAGDQNLGFRFLWMIDMFRYPAEGLSQSSIREIRHIKKRIDNERIPVGSNPLTHTKLGRGGLSDIEWAVQILQMRFVHKIPALQTTATLSALRVLGANELLSEQEIEILNKAWILVTRTRNALVLVYGKKHDELPVEGQELRSVVGIAGGNVHNPQAFLNNYLQVTAQAHKVATKVMGGAL